MNTLSVRESIKFGWEVYKKRPWILIGGFVLAMAVSGLSSALLSPNDNAAMGVISVLMLIASTIIGTLVEIGLVTFALKAHDSIEGVTFSDLWNPKPFWYYLAGQILVGGAIILGLILLIVPGIILSLGLLFASYLIVDKGRGPIEAMKESWRITKGHKWQIAVFMSAMLGLNILGALLLLVGLLVTIPVTMLAMAHVYRTLEHAASEIVPIAS